MISNRKRSKTQLQVQKLKLHTHRMTMLICKNVWELVDYTSNTGVAAWARGEDYGLKGINRKINERGFSWTSVDNEQGIRKGINSTLCIKDPTFLLKEKIDLVLISLI